MIQSKKPRASGAFCSGMAYSIKPMSAAATDELIGMVGRLEEVDDVTRLVRLVS
jgi:hypothetical protein